MKEKRQDSRNAISQGGVYALNPGPLYDALFPVHEPRNLMVQVRVVPLTMSLHDPLRDFVLTVPTVGSAESEVLVLKEVTFLPGYTARIH